MQKLQAGESAAVNTAMPVNQNVGLGSRLKENDDYGCFSIVTTIPAGVTGVVTPAALDANADELFDFEVLDVTVRTESTVASSTMQVKKNTTAMTDAIVSATANAITRAGSIDPAQNRFYPKSDPVGYAAAKCNLVDASGATAPKRTVTLFVRKI